MDYGVLFQAFLLGAFLTIIGAVAAYELMRSSVEIYYDTHYNSDDYEDCDDCDSNDDENDDSNDDSVQHIENAVDDKNVQTDVFEDFNTEYDKRIAKLKSELGSTMVSKTPPAHYEDSNDTSNDVEIITDQYEKEFEEHNKI